MNWTRLADEQTILKTVEALSGNGISALVVDNAHQAKEKVLELIPQGAEVMTQTSITLEETGIEKEINESGRFSSVKKKLASMNREQNHREMQRIGAAPEWTIGSVHAVTENGQVIIGSNSGSQLPGYVYGADHVIWVVSTKKIVKSTDDGINRVYEHVLPLESERARKAYGVDGSYVSKLLIINREQKPKRITLIFVKEQLGY